MDAQQYEAAGRDTEYTDPTPDRDEPDDDGCRCSWMRWGEKEVQDITGCPVHDVEGSVEEIFVALEKVEESQSLLAIKHIADVVRDVLVPSQPQTEEDFYLALCRVRDILDLEREEGRL